MAAGLRAKRQPSTQRSPRVKLPFVNSVNEAVIATDISGHVVFWNAVAERVYGWKWHEAMGRPIAELLVPDSAQPMAEKIMDQLRKGKIWTGEIMLRRRDGTQLLAIVTDHPMRDEKGNLVGIIGISHPKVEDTGHPCAHA
jgi:PAS domain S-box-containing protein